MRAAATLLAAAASLATSAGAQSVQGRVVSATSRRPIPGVPVRLLRVGSADSARIALDTAMVAHTVTGGDGIFALAAPDTGTYRARIGDEFFGPALHLVSVDTLDVREYQLRAADGRPLFEYEVKKQAALVGPLLVRYPAELQARCAEGKVVAQFVVDTAGRAELGTFRVLQSPEPLFSRAVRDAVRGAAFSPAEVGGRRVRQLMQQPVTFALGGVGACVPLSPFGPPAGAARAPGVTWPPAAPR